MTRTNLTILSEKGYEDLPGFWAEKGVEVVLKPLSEVTFESGHCPTCGVLRETEMTHVLTGHEPFLHRTLASIGVPPLHILRAHNSSEYRFYELTGDLNDALHFRHFEGTARVPDAHRRIRLGEQVESHDGERNPARGRVVIKV